jgi:pimeloyl-ACP methyl ester carboxylesterase
MTNPPSKWLVLMWPQLAGFEVAADTWERQLEGLASRNIPDLRSLGLDYSVPLFFFEGTRDTNTPIEPAEQYLFEVKAPHKEFVRFDGADHFLPMDWPLTFLRELLTRVRPLAVVEH